MQRGPGKTLCPGSHGRYSFLFVTGLAALAVVVYGAAIHLQIGGASRTPALDAVGLAIVQFTAAASCLAASTHASKLRLAWSLLAASTASGGLGRLLSSVYEAANQSSLSLPPIADSATLLGVALGIGAVLALPSAPGRASTRARVVINSAIIAISLFFIGWMVSLADVYRVSGLSALDLWLAIGYLAADVVLLAVLWQAILRARGSLRSAMIFLGSALLLIGVTTIAVTYVTVAGRFEPADRILDTGFFAAFLMIALAPHWPGVDLTLVYEEGPIKTSTVAIPPAAIAAVVLTIFGLRLAGRPIDYSPVPVVLGVVLMLLLTVGQVLAHRDSLSLLPASKRTESQLLDRTLLLDEVITHTPSGLARVGPGLRIIDPNPRVCSLFGAERHALIGAPLTRYLPPGDVENAIARFRPFDASRTDTVESDSHAIRTDGREVWVNWSVTAVRNTKRQIDYFIVMLEDIDAKHAAEQAAIANLAGLERLNRLKSEFVSMVSHEFRTALTGIQGFSELMRDGELEPAEVRQFAADIFSDAERLSRLITDMLDLDRIEAGRLTFRFAAVDLNRVATDAVERARATTFKHKIVLRLDPTVPIISADQDRLVQVLTNLLNNAIKYSPAGGNVVLTTRAGAAEVVVSVRDYGSGIPPEFMDRLFERFERYETKMTRSIVGTGLGLAIARRIVEGHGGHIWAESKVGEGSEFLVSLPRARGELV